VKWVAALCHRLHVAPLRTYGVGNEHVPDLASKAARASSMKGNPIALTGAELAEIAGRSV
jgi:alcohol dehydrogenase class IV